MDDLGLLVLLEQGIAKLLNRDHPVPIRVEEVHHLLQLLLALDRLLDSELDQKCSQLVSIYVGISIIVDYLSHLHECVLILLCEQQNALNSCAYRIPRRL